MKIFLRFPKRTVIAALAGAILLMVAGLGTPVRAQVTAFKQAVAEAAYEDQDVAAFYRQNDYRALWTEDSKLGMERRAALMRALRGAAAHGLPTDRYKTEALMQQMRDARTTRDLGLVEVSLSQAFLKYARDVQSGLLVPSRIDPGLVREISYRNRTAYLTEFAAAAPDQYIRTLPPISAEYRGLMKEKLRLEALVTQGGWGPTVPGSKIEPGDSGDQVIKLRNRLVAMGYMKPSATRSYGPEMQAAVRLFQETHGLEADGVAGKGTMAQINLSMERRLKSVIVAMERERWLARDRGTRHILVNLTDFTAKIVDDGRITFQTRSVVGKNSHDRRSPEFSDVMEHMIVNPSWHVPRSIVTKEYLPQLQQNPNAAGHILLTDSRGRRVNREETDFTQFTAGNFPFSMRQPPGQRNALGLVKFMFPNKHNIYLHDTPQKSLFKRESRAFSHGCIRLADPFDFAYALLARQEADPEDHFRGALNSGRETKIELVEPLPVHLIYRTAFITARGELEFRRDVYGRDAKIWDALDQAGVALTSVQG